MEFIGEYLKNVRVESKYDISTVAKELKIGKDILTSIESDNFPKHLSSVYLIGHIRAYSKFLKLDEDEIVKKFKIQTLYDDKNSKRKIVKPITKNNFSIYPKTFSFISIIFISISFYFLFIKKEEIEKNYAMTPQVPENILYTLEREEMNLVFEEKDNDDVKTDSLIVEDNNSIVNSNSAIASLPTDSTDLISFNITLKFLNPTWIQLRNKNDQIIFSKLMDQGEEYTYNSLQELYLTAGNAGNIIIAYDGKTKGKVGKAGEVIDSLIVENIFDK